MDSERLQAIKERWSKATPGPLEVEFVDWGRNGKGYKLPQVFDIVGVEDSHEDVIERSEDAEFFANAWEDIKALLDALEGGE